MADSYSVKARLSATDSGFSSTLKSAIGLTDSFKSKISSIGTGILQGVGQSLFSSIQSGISNMVGELNSASGAWKTFEGNMSMLGKSAKEIAGVKKELQTFATESIYSASDMASTYSQLAAVGVSNTTELVKGFGGLAAAAENPQQAMKTLSQQATQMAAKPNVAWQDFKLMLEQTPAGLAQVAKAMGMTTSELVQNVQAGTVATDDFFAAIVKAAGTGTELNKLATEYKTIDQAASGLQETIATKLSPAFDVLSNIGIKALSGIIDKIGKIDGQAIADKVSGWIKKAQPLWNSFSKAVTKVWGVISGVAKKLAPIFQPLSNKIGGAFKSIMDKIGSIDVESVVNKISTAINKAKPYVDAFAKVFSAIGKAIAAVVPWIIKIGSAIATYLLDNSERLSKAIPYIVGLVGAFKGFKIIKALVPGMASFAKSITQMATKGLTGLAGKLFGVAKGQQAAGTASQTSWPAMAAAAKAFMMIGAGVLMASGGLALLAQSAIALAAAGWPAIAVMFGLVVALAALMIGTLAFVNTLSASAAQMTAAGTAMMLLGAAVLMIGTGFTLLAVSSIALANAGWGAIGVMIGMVAAIALLAVVVTVCGSAMLVGAVGFLAFGAAILLLGIGAILAATSLVILSTCLPVLAANGVQASVAIVALGAALYVFGAGALFAGVGALVLGAGLLVVAVAVAVLAAGILVLSVGALITAASLAIMAAILPTIAAYGLQGAMAIVALSAAMIVFSIGAGLAGAAAIVLGAGLLVASVGILLCAAGMAILAASVLIIGSYALIAAASFAIMAALLPVVTANSLQNAAAMAILAGGLIVLGAGALVAGAGFVVLGAGLMVAAVGIAAVAVGIALLGVAIITLSLGALVAAASIALLSLALPTLVQHGAQAATALLAFGVAVMAVAVPMIALAASAGMCAIAIGAFGVAMVAACIGVAALALALKAVSSSMKSIASSAKKAEKSLDSMTDAVDVVEAGLDAIGDKAKSAMDKLKSAFDKTAGSVEKSGKKVGTGFTKGMQTGLALAAPVAAQTVLVVNTTLLAGYASAFSAGANISRGFAQGMLSCLALIRSAATQMAAQADKAVRAKAKIHSPSKVAAGLGSYWGEGFAVGITDMAKSVQKAAESLVAVPTVAAPDLAMSYGGELSSDYNYSNSYVITVPLTLDGREVAKATVRYNQDELNRSNLREERKYGRV